MRAFQRVVCAAIVSWPSIAAAGFGSGVGAPARPNSNYGASQQSEQRLQLAGSSGQPANNRSAPALQMRSAPLAVPTMRSSTPSYVPAPSYMAPPSNVGRSNFSGSSSFGGAPPMGGNPVYRSQPSFPTAPSVAQPTFSPSFQGVGGQTTQSTIRAIPPANSNNRATPTSAPPVAQYGAPTNYQNPINSTSVNQPRSTQQTYFGATGPTPSNSFQGTGGQTTSPAVGAVPPPTPGRLSLTPVATAPPPALPTFNRQQNHQASPPQIQTSNSPQRITLPSATPNNVVNPMPVQTMGGQSTSSTVVGAVPPPISGRVQLAPVSKQQIQRPGDGQVVRDTISGIPSAARTVLERVGNAVIASEKAAGENIAAAIGAAAYQKKIGEIRSREQESFNQLVKSRSDERAAGRDTSNLDQQIRNFTYTPDDTNKVFPALDKTNGQVVKDFAGVGLDVVTAGVGSNLKAAKGAAGAAHTVERARTIETSTRAATLTESKSIAQFANENSLLDHFQRHGVDFQAKNFTDYQNKASRFLTSSRTESTMEKVRTNGDIIRFNSQTNEFGVLSRDGTIRTYYKPDPAIHGKVTNIEYFNAQ